jgi:hypothetical protein
MTTIPCEWCGTPFTPKAHNSKYCNKQCSGAAGQARYRLAHPERVAATKAANYQANRGRIEAKKREYREANKDKVKQYFAEYHEQNREARNAATNANYHANKEARAAAGKARYQKNKERIAARNKAWNEANRARIAARQRERRKNDPTYKLTTYLRSRLGKVLREARVKKTIGTFKLLGCTVKECIAHLEAQFQPGMTWENYGAWHVDHIKPISSFNILDPEQQRICFNYTNLQPLWGEDNLAKGARF